MSWCALFAPQLKPRQQFLGIGCEVKQVYHFSGQRLTDKPMVDVNYTPNLALEAKMLKLTADTKGLLNRISNASWLHTITDKVKGRDLALKLPSKRGVRS